MARIETGRIRPVSPLSKLAGVCAVALMTANCAGTPQKLAGASADNGVDPKYGVRASRRLYSEGDVIPKGGGRRFSGKPYVVAGRTYVPREDARGYVREGLASWYGAAFHGRMTANGEVFDRHSIAAAHPTLPLPSYARVTNLENGRSMVVRVNDRGPYHAGRVMDVSEEVASALEFHAKGTAAIRVEYVGKASIAGSDDRKLMATLRTDGRPAAIGPRSPVMLADLGSDGEGATEHLSAPARPALAFRPPHEAEEPAPPVRRRAPILVAGAATVAVPAALQPTSARPNAFRPAPLAAPARPPASSAVAARSAPLSLSPPPIQLAGATAARPAAFPHEATRPKIASAPAGSASSAMPASARLAMARLASAVAPPARKPAADARSPRPTAASRARLAAVD